MMQLGYYWARRGNKWCIVEVVQGLHGAVLEGGYSVPLAEFDEFRGPLVPPGEQADERFLTPVYAREP